MADVTWGVKVPEELKEKLTSTMQEAGLSGKEFIETLYQAYEINRLKEAQPIIKADLEEMQLLTSRIYGIFVSLGERIENITKAKDSEYQTELESKNDTISMYYSKIKELEALIDLTNQERINADEHASEIDSRNKELLEMLEANKELVVEYKQKNDTLAGVLNEYKEYKTVNEQMRNEIQSIEKEKNTMELAIEKANRDVEQAIKKLEEVENKAKNDIENVLAQAELDKGNAILKLRNECQVKIEELQKRIADIQDGHGNKIKSLLDRIEELQKENASLYKKKNKKEHEASI